MSDLAARRVLRYWLPVSDNARYWGTTARTDDGLVWHLFELNTTNPAGG